MPFAPGREDFFSALTEFSALDDITHQAHYRDAPDDWFVVITDVRGSTAAVAEGHYKEVNTIGAACIISGSPHEKPGWLAQRLHYLGVALLTGLLTIVVRKTRDQPQYAATRYIASLCRNNDYLKLVDYLQMVIDVTHLQRQKIETLLDRSAYHCNVSWGSHFSNTALFT